MCLASKRLSRKKLHSEHTVRVRLCSSLLLATATSLGFSQTICIDPGHPSEVGRGTQGKKITEVRAAWLVAKLLEKELKSAGYNVVLTKKSELQFVKNRDRARIANEAKADLMVRLHCDANEGGGFAVYVPTKKGTSQGRKGPSEAIIKSSTEAGKVFHPAFSAAIGSRLKDNGLVGDERTAVGGRQGALTGSIFSEVPVVLVEMCCLTNAKDEAFMASESGRRAMAKALLAGIKAAIPLNSLGTKKRPAL